MLNFRDMISAVTTLGLFDKNPIIMKILMGIEEEYGDSEMDFLTFLGELTARLVTLFKSFLNLYLGTPFNRRGKRITFQSY